MMDLNDPRARLAQLIAADGASYAALSRMLRRNDAYLQQFVHRGSPRHLAERDRALLAAYFRIDATELGAPGTTAPLLTPIRRLDVEASAGSGAVLDGTPAQVTMLLDPRLLDDLRLNPATTAMLRVRGDSMEPTLADGDRIMIDERDTEVTATPRIFVVRHQDDMLVKRVSKPDGGRMPDFVLASDNPAYAPIITSTIDIVGRVVWLSRALR